MNRDQTLQNKINKARKGNEEAFREIIRETQEFAFRIAYRYSGNKEDAEDTVQDAYMKIWVKMKTYDGSAQFTTWLYEIIKNQCIDKIRKKRNREHYLTYKKQEQGENLTNNDPEHNLLLDQVIIWSNQLPEKQREVFHLRDLEGLSIEEVMSLTGLPEDSVKSNLYLARKKIRQVWRREKARMI